jgi:hypothetical protein
MVALGFMLECEAFIFLSAKGVDFIFYSNVFHFLFTAL